MGWELSRGSADKGIRGFPDPPMKGKGLGFQGPHLKENVHLALDVYKPI
jgi:hypothetical protein